MNVLQNKLQLKIRFKISEHPPHLEYKQNIIFSFKLINYSLDTVKVAARD